MLRAQIQIGRRMRQLRTALRSEGPGWLAERARHAISERIRPASSIPQVRPADVLAADLSDCTVVPALPYAVAAPVLVNWVMLPPSAGSGGHTTIFRILRHLEANGFSNRVYFYDPYLGDHQYYASIVGDYFGFEGMVSNIDDGMRDAHVVMATSWPTAYPVYSARTLGRKFYFVQDFEPAFYATCTDSILSENTYRMRLHAVTAGRWLAQKLARDYGMEAGHFDFGCDTSQYRLEGSSARNGVAFYARPGAPRRGFELGIMTLELLKQRRPDIEVHLYGSKIGRLPFDFIDHGLVSPKELNSIYNRCRAGLTLSLTNVSLVPHEMLATGCIPVVNDAEHNRIVLDNPFVRYAAHSPHALAGALEAVVDEPDFDALSRAAADSVRTAGWDDAGRQVDKILRQSLAS
ncbi:MAG: hypothetical protein JWQ89_1916 [Devosia sp.]|uniref:rhamnosyltransferase WsaF family glycosyltransferase n=1 Tax=Devosia sp. TaxID=1871048 RepID=UPI00262DFB22|nr:glycosyltransferase family 1 protein [Devosia sp.]MDB5540189.1 hypothetical protein [Devosia sp.]